MRWSPMRIVFSIEPLGMTRAWTRVPSMKMNARITQNQDRSSRLSFWPGVSVVCGCCLGLPLSLFDLSADTVSLHFQLHELGRIHTSVAGCAKFSFAILDGGAQIFQRQVAKRIGADEFADSFNRIARGNQFALRGRVHAVMAWGNRGGATDAHVNFDDAGVAHHAHDFAAGGAANDGVVHEDDALAFEEAANGIQLQADAEIADGLLGFDKRAADIMVADQAHAKRQAGLAGVTDGRRNSGIGHGHDHVRGGGMLAGEKAAEALTREVHGPAEYDAIGPGEIDVLENAVLMRLFRREANGFDAALGDAQHFARLDFAFVFSVDKIEGAGLRRNHPRAAAPAEAEPTEAARVTDGEDFVTRENQERIRAFDLTESIGDGASEISDFAACHEMDDDLGVAGGLEDGAFVFERAAQFAGVR